MPYVVRKIIRHKTRNDLYLGYNNKWAEWRWTSNYNYRTVFEDVDYAQRLMYMATGSSGEKYVEHIEDVDAGKEQGGIVQTVAKAKSIDVDKMNEGESTENVVLSTFVYCVVDTVQGEYLSRLEDNGQRYFVDFQNYMLYTTEYFNDAVHCLEGARKEFPEQELEIVHMVGHVVDSAGYKDARLQDISNDLTREERMRLVEILRQSI